MRVKLLEPYEGNNCSFGIGINDVPTHIAKTLIAEGKAEPIEAERAVANPKVEKAVMPEMKKSTEIE